MPSGWAAFTSTFCCSKERTVWPSDRIAASANRRSSAAVAFRVKTESSKATRTATPKPFWYMDRSLPQDRVMPECRVSLPYENKHLVGAVYDRPFYCFEL